MADKKDNLIKATTKSGIKLVIDKRVKDDTRLLFYLSQLQNKSLSEMEQSTLLFQLLGLIFGSNDGLAIFLNEVAAHHDGVADPKNVLAELQDLFDALKLKN